MAPVDDARDRLAQIERPPACPRPGQIEPFDAGWNAHEIGLARETVRVSAADPGWALLGWDTRQLAEIQQLREERDAYLKGNLWVTRAAEEQSRAEAAEAEVRRLQNKLNEDSQNFEIECLKAEVQRLQEELLLNARHPNDQEKIDAWWRARSEVKVDGNSRAEYVLQRDAAWERAESAEARLVELLEGRDYETWARRVEAAEAEVQRLRSDPDGVARWRGEAEMYMREFGKQRERADRLTEGLREIERMAGAAGYGETPAKPIAEKARALLQEGE